MPAFFPFRFCSPILCGLAMASSMSLRPRAQDLLERLRNVVPFVRRKSDHGKGGGKGLHTGCNFDFQNKTLCVIYFTRFLLPFFPFQLSLLLNSYYRSQPLAKVAHKNDSSEAAARAHPRLPNSPSKFCALNSRSTSPLQ